MNQEMSDLRKERLRELEDDFNRIQSTATSFLSETEEEFASTISSINTSSLASSIQIGISARSTHSKASEVIRSFENLETRYRFEASNLRKELRKLEKRIHFIESLSIPLIFQPLDDQKSNSFQQIGELKFNDEVYNSVFLPDLPKNESYRLDTIENQIKTIERLLSDDDVEKLEESNQRELEYVTRLEEENKRLKSRSENLGDSTTISLSSITMSPIKNLSKSFVNHSIKDDSNYMSPNASFSFSKENKSSRVQKKIDSLISVLNDRRLKFKMDLKETKKREEKLKLYQEKQKELLAKKMDQIEKLKKKLNGVQKYSENLQTVQSDIGKSRDKLKQLIEEKEQTERKNFTTARDKHANSEAKRRLNEMKGRVQNKKIETDMKEKEIEKRRKLYNEELKIVNKRNEIAEAREKEIMKMMNKLSGYGIDFQNKLVESQKELEARNLAASLRKKESRNKTLEQQLADLLQNASSEIYDE